MVNCTFVTFSDIDHTINQLYRYTWFLKLESRHGIVIDVPNRDRIETEKSDSIIGWRSADTGN